ncbi:hypothetical protein [Gordonia sp. (in: high G+C Gram-positive bacteria)]|uniref:hypothetical protein n=1 Tax=Gordonia sp. (in: high G+C Gram-positive bacteria) TaxID=84139 RepID=UPI003F962CF7
MAIEKGGRSIRGIRYDGDGIGRVIILKAVYDDPILGRVIVWDGRISENIPAPAIPFVVSMPSPEVHADATVAGAEITYWLSPPTVSVSAGSSPVGPPIEYTATLEAPSGLSGSHKIGAPATEYTADLEDGAVASSIGGEFVDPMEYTVGLPAPVVHADANVSAPPMVFYIEPAAPTVGAFADVDGGVIEYTAEVVAPTSITASSSPAGAASSIVVAPVAPSPSASSAASGQPISYTLELAPGEGVSATLTRQRINKSSGTNVTSGYIAGWTSDATYPGTVTGDQNLSVVGAGEHVYVRTKLDLNSSINGDLYLRHNGANVQPDVLTGVSTSVSGQYSLDLSHADELSLWTSISSTGSQTAAGGYIEVRPAVGVPTFDAAISYYGSSGSTSRTITTAAGATLVIVVDATLSGSGTVKVDGVDAVKVDGATRGTDQWWIASGLAAGSHTITFSATAGISMTAVSYTGVTDIGIGNGDSGTFTSTRTATALYGAGQLNLYGFYGSGIGDPSTTSTGAIRTRIKNSDTNSKSILFVDSTSDTVTANLGSAGSISYSALRLY